MKRITRILSLILFITIIMMGNAYAALDCKVDLAAAKSEISKNETFTVDVNLSDVQSENGIISLGGTLEYDKNSLELEKMEGKNGWETPSNGISFNESNGKIAITRNALGKDDETIFTITFKVKEETQPNLVITFKDITVADGDKPVKLSVASEDIKVKDVSQKPSTPTEPDNPNKPVEPSKPNTNTTINANTNSTNTTQNGNSNPISNLTISSSSSQNQNSINKSNTVTAGSLPHTGNNNSILLVVIGIIVFASAVFLIKMKADKKI